MKKMFGYHCFVSTTEVLNNVVDGAIEFLAPLGLNYIVFEINNGFKFKSHPEICAGTVTAEQLSEACARLRAAGIEPVPLYNCIGHQGWNSRNSLLQAYPEFDETPHIPDEKLVCRDHVWDGEKFLSTYCPTWCCNEPKVYDIVLPAMDEIVDAMDAKYIHLGMDEIFLFGQCDRCRGIKAVDLFRDNLMMLYNHFKEKGVGTMIWGDRLLNATKLLGEEGVHRALTWKDFENVGTSECIDDLPKDIILCDWHYGLEERYPSVNELLTHDYPIWPSCWYNGESAEALWKASLEEAEKLGRKDQLPGMLVTGWSMRGLKDIFTLPDSELKDMEIQLRETFPRVAKLMQEYN